PADRFPGRGAGCRAEEPQVEAPGADRRAQAVVRGARRGRSGLLTPADKAEREEFMTATESTPIPATGYTHRRDGLRAVAEERGLDGLLVVSRGANGADWGADIVYLTNHYSAFPQIPDRPGQWSGRGYSGLVMTTDAEGTLVVEIPDWRTDLVAID